MVNLTLANLVVYTIGWDIGIALNSSWGKSLKACHQIQWSQERAVQWKAYNESIYCSINNHNKCRYSCVPHSSQSTGRWPTSSFAVRLAADPSLSSLVTWRTASDVSSKERESGLARDSLLVATHFSHQCGDVSRDRGRRFGARGHDLDGAVRRGRHRHLSGGRPVFRVYHSQNEYSVRLTLEMTTYSLDLCNWQIPSAKNHTQRLSEECVNWLQESEKSKLRTNHR